MSQKRIHEELWIILYSASALAVMGYLFYLYRPAAWRVTADETAWGGGTNTTRVRGRPMSEEFRAGVFCGAVVVTKWTRGNQTNAYPLSKVDLNRRTADVVTEWTRDVAEAGRNQTNACSMSKIELYQRAYNLRTNVFGNAAIPPWR